MRGPLQTLTLIILAVLPGIMPGPPRLAAQELAKTVVSTESAEPTYPDTPEGLESLLLDVFASVKSSDSSRISQYLQQFAIPNESEWFLEAFGSSQGPRLEAKYRELAPRISPALRRLFESAVQAGRTDVAAQVHRKGDEQKVALLGAALAAMSAPSAHIYTATGGNRENKSSMPLGSFVYVNGGFRFLAGEVVQALSAAPERISMDGNAASARLVHVVRPVLSSEAKSAHLAGVVRLHAILSTEGVPTDVTVVSGNPILAEAALDAVRQWRYAPTTQNGAAVEVDVMIDVSFGTAPR